MMHTCENCGRTWSDNNPRPICPFCDERDLIEDDKFDFGRQKL
jgi:rubrerythrin